MTWFRALLVSLLAGATPLDAEAREGRRVLVYDDSNSWGWKPVLAGLPTGRYPDEVRWPGVMARHLGPNVTVVDALSGRTVDVDHPGPVGTLPGAQFDGSAALPQAIAREMPLDLVVVTLGTDDVRADLARSPAEVGAGIRRLVEAATGAQGGVFTTDPAPALLVVVPPPIGDVSRTPIRDVMLPGGRDTSPRLPAAYRGALVGSGVRVFDAGEVTATDGVDGVHLTPDDHGAPGRALAREVRSLLDAR